MLNSMMENDHVRCCEHDIRKGIEILAKTCVFIFHHSIQHDEASGYTFSNSPLCFEYFRIALTICLQKIRKSRDSSPLSLLTRYNTLASWRKTSTFKQMGTTTISSSGYQSCNWPCSGLFFLTCSGCNSGFYLVVVLEYTSFQLCCNTKKIS